MVERQFEARDRRPRGGGRNPDRRRVIDLHSESRASRLRQVLDRELIEAGGVGALDRHHRVTRLAFGVDRVEAERQTGLVVARLEMPPAALADADQLRPVVLVGNAGREPAAPGLAESLLEPLAQTAAQRVVGGMTVADLNDPHRVLRLALFERGERGEERRQRGGRRQTLLDRRRRWRGKQAAKSETGLQQQDGAQRSGAQRQPDGGPGAAARLSVHSLGARATR